MQRLILPESTRRCRLFFGLLMALVCLLQLLLDTEFLIKILFLISTGLLGYFMFFANIGKEVSLQKIDDAIWKIEFSSGRLIQGKLLGSSISTSLFCIIVVKSPQDWTATRLLVFNDALPPLQYHRLRLQLKGLLP